MKINIVSFVVPALIGFVLGTAGITWTDWQLHVVLILAAIGHFIGHFDGWKAHVAKMKEVDGLRRSMCAKRICPYGKDIE